MKFTSLVLPSVVASMSISFIEATPKATKDPYFYTPQGVGSFNGTSNNNFNLYFEGAKKGYTILFTLYSSKSHEQLYQKEYSVSINSGRTYGQAYVTFPAKDYLLSTGTLVYIEGFDENKERICYHAFNIFPKTTTQHIYANLYKQTEWIEDGYYFIIQKDTNKVYTWEAVDFSNTLDTISCEEDNSIDITQIHYTFWPNITLFGVGAAKYLKIKDDQNIYPYIEKDEDGYINIPLVGTQKGQDISFKYSKTMYVKESTLDMSLTAREGFTSTKKFYVPLRKEKLLAQSEIEIYTPSFARGKNIMHIPLTFETDNEAIGFCGMSNHCIVGGIKS